REAERARQLILGQRRVAQLLRSRGRAAALLRTDWFQEALLLHALGRVAAGAGAAEVLADIAALRRTAGTGSGAEGPTQSPVPTVEGALDDGSGRRRRRRRRRKPGEPGEPGERSEATPAEQDGESPGDDEPVENEDAALDAFAVVMNDRRFDE